MPERQVHKALSSEARVETLKLLYKKPHDIEEIAQKLKLQPVTVRHHIQTLIEAGLLESYEERSGSAGRPKTFYKIIKSLPLVTFPARRYLDFSKPVVSAIVKILGKSKADELLAQVGHEMGVQTVNYIGDKNKVKEWTPDAFAEYFIGQYLEEAGTQPEIIEKTDKKVLYRTHNCVFFELSQQMPSLMCDVLHHEFHQSLLEAMNNGTKGTQKTCMGHGDAYCEHLVEWNSKEKTADKKE